MGRRIRSTSSIPGGSIEPDGVLPSYTLATAAVDRFLHHAHLVLTEGGSLRLAEATAGKGVKPLI